MICSLSRLQSVIESVFWQSAYLIISHGTIIMAQTTVPDVHLETVEEAQDEISQPPETRRAGKACQDDGRKQTVVLGRI